MARHSRQIRTRKAIAILGEGITERYYFEGLRKHENYGFKIKPEKPQNSDFTYIFKKAKQLVGDEYDLVYCIIDLDKIVENTTLMKKYLKEKASIKSSNIKIIEINPCFELWFLLHYKKTGKCFKDCDETIKCARKIPELKKYEKTHAYFKRNNLYQKLFEKLNLAISNSKWINSKRTLAQHSKCDVYKIIEKLRSLK